MTPFLLAAEGGRDGLGITVEITPAPATCVGSCGLPPEHGGPGGGSLPATGGELASVALAVALVAAGLIATVGARVRRRVPAPARAVSAPPPP